MVKVGLVLSGGGARGFAQIGALKVLRENNIEINFISGSSIGALIGACYAHNQNPKEIADLFLKIKGKRDVYDYAFSAKGLIKGEKLEKYITEYFISPQEKNFKFEDLKIPLVINATDITLQKEIIFDKGELIPAIMASISYPGFFTTRTINGKMCVDGAVVNPLPFDLIHGADYLIMIDVSKQNIKINQNSNFKDIVLQATLAMQRTIVEKSLEGCSIPYTIIRPDVEYHGVLEFDDLLEVMKKGEEEAKKSIEKIKQDINNIENKGNYKIIKA